MVHNGIHKYSLDYFEWWYFHFISENGLYFSLILHPTDIFGEDQNPYFSVSMYAPSGQIYYFREDLPLNFFDNCDNKINCESKKISLFEKKDSFRLSICLDDLKIEGDISRINNPINFNKGILYKNNDSNLINHWIVGMPYGHYKFNIGLFNNNFNSEGISYHDHNWGTAKIQDYFTSWIWGHLIFNEGFILFYHVKTLDGELLDRGLLKYKNHLQKFTNYKLNSYLEDAYLSVLNMPSIFNLTIPLSNDTCKVKIKAGSIFRKREDYKYKSFIPLYYRAQCHADIQLNNKKYTAYGLTENLIIKKR